MYRSFDPREKIRHTHTHTPCIIMYNIHTQGEVGERRELTFDPQGIECKVMYSVCVVVFRHVHHRHVLGPNW